MLAKEVEKGTGGGKYYISLNASVDAIYRPVLLQVSHICHYQS
jgi:hypothetical protein